MRSRRLRAPFLLGPLLAAATLPACSLFVDLDPLSNGAGGGGAGGTGGSGGASGGGSGGASSTGGGGGLITFVDDELPGEIAEGTFEGTEWAAEGVLRLAGTGTGMFTSRVFDAGAPATWLSLGWAPLGPYSKALPDGGEKEEHEEGGADMTANVLLLHLDGAGAIEPGDKLPDTSGLGYFATAAGAPLAFTTGRFGQALADTTDSYAYVNTAASPELAFGTEDFTWSIWVKSTEDCTGNKVHIGLDDGTGDTPHLWLGCAHTGNLSCPAGAPGGRGGGTLKSNHQSGTGGGICGSSRIDDGAWHHLAVVKQGHPDVTLTLHVDGAVEAVAQATWAMPIAYSTNPELAIGAFSEGTYPAEGTFDEVAIWRRALSAAEVTGVYRRGALRLRFQVRGCQSAGCDDGPVFVGPGGDPARSYVAPPGPDALVKVALDAVSEGGGKVARYLQYRAFFESDALPAVPGLRSVELAGQVP